MGEQQGKKNHLHTELVFTQNNRWNVRVAVQNWNIRGWLLLCICHSECCFSDLDLGRWSFSTNLSYSTGSTNHSKLYFSTFWKEFEFLHSFFSLKFLFSSTSICSHNLPTQLDFLLTFLFFIIKSFLFFLSFFHHQFFFFGHKIYVAYNDLRLTM